MRSESVRFGRTLECECGAQMDFNLTASASVSYLHIQAKCPNCRKDVEIRVDTGAAGSTGGSFEFQDIGEEGEVQGSAPDTSGYSEEPSAESGAYDIFDEPG